MTDTLSDDFANVPYDSLGITIAGVGATMGSTLAVETGDPIRKHERAYVLLYTECQKISFPDDKDGNQIRVAHLHPQDAFWISPEDARGLVVKQAAERERRKAELDGQEQLFAEQEAEQREALDVTGTPEEIAAAAGQRAKQKP
jgi:hypothetical protein